jgi:RNA polymerase sigma-70 factor (ECF subfamily)
MQTTSVSLLERLRRPDAQAAWERFVRLYTPLLNHWAHRLGLRGPDVDDLLQDVFTVIVEKLPAFQYDPQKRFRGWLWTVTVNTVRKKQRRLAHETQAPDTGLPDLADPNGVEVIDEAEYRCFLVKRALELMQADFEPSTWKAFYECVAGDRPAAEVAAEFGLSLDAVYTAKSRVLRRLRQDLDGLLD